MKRLAIASVVALAVTARAERPVRVLTYSSMLGKGSLGELVRERFSAACDGCSIEFTESKDLAGILGRLRASKREGRLKGVDFVMGLDGDAFRNAVMEGILADGQMLDRSPYAIIVDLRRLPKDQWPKSWKDLPASKLKGRLLIEDPRFSGVGYGWLKAMFQTKRLSVKDAKTVVSRIFPGWSSAYAAFTEGEGAAVWSYRTSEAYHRCKGKTPAERDSFRALPLEEGYPVQEEWSAVVKNGRPHPKAKELLAILDSKEIQERIPTTNWMLPASKDVKLPDCFEGLTPVREDAALPAPSAAQTRDWLDEWSLI